MFGNVFGFVLRYDLITKGEIWLLKSEAKLLLAVVSKEPVQEEKPYMTVTEKGSMSHRSIYELKKEARLTVRYKCKTHKKQIYLI